MSLVLRVLTYLGGWMNPPRTRLEEGATQTAGITETKASSDTPKETVATVQETPEDQVPTIKSGNRGEQGHSKRDRGKPAGDEPQGGRRGRRSQPPHRGGGRDQSRGQPRGRVADSTPAEEAVRTVGHEQEVEREGHWTNRVSNVNDRDLPIYQADSVAPARAHDYGTHIILNLQPAGKSKFNNLFGVAAVLDTGQTTGADIVMSEAFFEKCVGEVENLSDPPTQGTVSASGGELKAIGSFSARISIDGLFSFKPAAARVVVYKNLNADLLLGTAFFVRATREGGKKVSLGIGELGYYLETGGQTAGAVTNLQAWAVNKLMREYVELRRKKLPLGANYKNPILRQRKKIRTCNTPLQWRRMVKQVFPESFRLQGDSKNHNEIEDEEASTYSSPPLQI